MNKVFQCPYTIHAKCTMQEPCIDCDDFKGIEVFYNEGLETHFDRARKVVENWPDWKKEYKI